MNFGNIIKRHPIIFGIGLVITSLYAYDRLDYHLAPILEGKVIWKTEIPSYLPVKSKQEYPYYVDISTKANDIVRLYFDTDDKTYDSKTQKDELGLSLYIGRTRHFVNLAVELEEKICLGCKIGVKVVERSGSSRTVQDLLHIWLKDSNHRQ